MEHKPHTSPKDFFLHLLSIIALYICAINIGVLFFQVINFNFPDELYYFNQGFYNVIRWSISSIIVALPTLFFTSRHITKDYQKDPEKKNLKIRTWLIYFTMFATAVIVLVDLMSVIYEFLGGELTIRFALKALTIFYIAGVIFAYYWYKIKAQKESTKVLFSFFGLTLVSFILAVGMGFYYIGTPGELRLRNFDDIRINDLGNLSSNIQSYYYQFEKLPENFDELLKSNYNYIPVDPQTGKNYEYIKKSDLSFEVCAQFSTTKIEPKQGNRTEPISQYIYNKAYIPGRNCFEQFVTPDPKNAPFEVKPIQ